MLAICRSVIFQYSNNKRRLSFAVVAHLFSPFFAFSLQSTFFRSNITSDNPHILFALEQSCFYCYYRILSLLCLPSLARALSLISRNRRGGNFVCPFYIWYRHSSTTPYFSNTIATVPFPVIRNNAVLYTCQHHR